VGSISLVSLNKDEQSQFRLIWFWHFFSIPCRRKCSDSFRFDQDWNQSSLFFVHVKLVVGFMEKSVKT